MKLDLKKKVQTRDGRPVEIKFTDGRGDYQITGYIDDAKLTDCWTIDGKYDERDGKESQWDLINSPAWHLPDPPEGFEWHRTDWTEEMLPEGWRPLLLGEMRENADEWTYNHKEKWNEVRYFGPDGCTVNAQAALHRTRRPLPPPKPNIREVQLCADDVKAGDEFLAPSGRRLQWVEIDSIEIAIGGVWRSWKQLKDEGWKIRSIRETEWRKCSKMEEVPA